MDDIFLLFKSPDHIHLFQVYMNQQHPSMEFTSECEENGSLSFLDVLVSSENGKFVTNLYRKPTFSGVFSNFSSFIPDAYKFGLVYCLLFRCYHLCSTNAMFHMEVLSLKSILMKNGYTLSFIDCCVRKFLNSVYRPKGPRAQVAEKKNVFLVLPFMGATSVTIRNRIVKMCRKYLPQVDCKVIFKPSVRVCNFFPFKDKIPKSLKSCVLYNFQCSACNSSYYGKSIRHLKTRACEHLGISECTGKFSSTSSVCNSAVWDHITAGPLDCFSQASLDSFSVLASATCDFHLKIKESLLIQCDKPNLNVNVASLPLKLF